jgi:hypothetical protein
VNRVRAFGAFLYDFVIGDDWRIAAGVVVALIVTAVAGAWWILPAFVAVMLGVSVWSVAGSDGS